MTSVSGHLLQHDFPSCYKNWTETSIKMLFDVNVQKNTIQGMEDVRATLIEEVRKSDVSFEEVSACREFIILRDHFLL